MLGESQPLEGCELLLGTHLNGSGADFSSNAATPTETSMAWTNGIIGNQCGNFDGTASYISYPNLAAYNILSGCFSFWIKSTNTSTVDYMYITCKSDNTPSNDNFLIGANFSTASKLGYYSTGAWRQSNASVCDGNWHHVVLVGTTNSGLWYIDGELDSSHSFNPFIASGSAALFYISNRAFDANHQWLGQIDEFMFMSGLPTAVAIKKYYTACKGRFGIL